MSPSVELQEAKPQPVAPKQTKPRAQFEETGIGLYNQPHGTAAATPMSKVPNGARPSGADRGNGQQCGLPSLVPPYEQESRRQSLATRWPSPAPEAMFRCSLLCAPVDAMLASSTRSTPMLHRARARLACLAE